MFTGSPQVAFHLPAAMKNIALSGNDNPPFS
jgi:hypothetical protein